MVKPIVIEEVTDPDEIAKARAQRKRFDRNSAWLQAHAQEIYDRHVHLLPTLAGQPDSRLNRDRRYNSAEAADAVLTGLGRETEQSKNGRAESGS